MATQKDHAGLRPGFVVRGVRLCMKASLSFASAYILQEEEWHIEERRCP